MSEGRRSQEYVAKADECLAGAESEFTNRRFTNCANRADDARFQAAIAALIRVGIGPSPDDQQWRHHAVRGQFSAQLVHRRKLYSASLSSTLERGAIIRATAEYSTDQVNESQARRAPRHSRAFVEAVKRQGGPTT